MKYSIHRALAELKLLDSKINKITNTITLIGLKKNSAKTEYYSRTNAEEFEENAKSKYASIIDLITRRDKIKQLIVESNANTIVTINKENYTVAAAIERKNSISYSINLLNNLKNQYNKITSTVLKNNDDMERNLDMQISNMLGNDKNKNTEIALFTDLYRKENGWIVIDPINLKQIIEELEDKIDGFQSEVDYVLSTSNAITEIEI